MTIDALEKSTYSGEPVELYQFARGASQFWRYTSADENKSYLANVYRAIPIKRNKIETSQDIARIALQIRLPSSDTFCRQFVGSPPTESISVTLRRYHEGDPEVAEMWIGRMINITFEPPWAKIRCESSQVSLKRPTLRRFYQLNCPHVLYQSNTCRLLLSSWRTTTALSGVNGLVISATDFDTPPDGYYTGGFVEYINGGAYNRRYIRDHIGPDLTLNLPLADAVAGVTVNAYPGCDHSWNTCTAKFSNGSNFGGFPHIPFINPMGNNPIFY